MERSNAGTTARVVGILMHVQTEKEKEKEGNARVAGMLRGREKGRTGGRRKKEERSKAEEVEEDGVERKRWRLEWRSVEGERGHGAARTSGSTRC